MNKNNLIQFAQSLIILPFVTGAMTTGNILDINRIDQTVFIQKENIVADSLLAINQVIGQEANDSKVKAEAIDAYFESRNMPLSGMGTKMVQEAEKNNLDWRLLPAIAVRESSGGKNDCIKVTFNPFGWGSCKIGFSSNEEAIEIVAKNLGGNNPNTAKHYSEKNTEEILKAYNPPSIVPNYVKQVMKIMDDIGDADSIIEISS